MITTLRRTCSALAIAAAFTVSIARCQQGGTSDAVVTKPTPKPGATPGNAGGAVAAGPTEATKLNWDGLSTKGNGVWQIVPTN